MLYRLLTSRIGLAGRRAEDELDIGYVGDVAGRSPCMVLCLVYAMSGTDVGCAASRDQNVELRGSISLRRYAFHRRCPVLRYAILRYQAFKRDVSDNVCQRLGTAYLSAYARAFIANYGTDIAYDVISHTRVLCDARY
eukprot:1949855-Rhodomonas_salina.6